MLGQGVVAAVRNESYSRASLCSAFNKLLENLVPPLPNLVKRTDRVLVKVNMGCSGLRSPDDRVTTHPALVEAIIRAAQDCGARVSFGDDVARVGKYCDHLWRSTGMWEVSQNTGAALVDFVGVGAREIRGGLLYPRKYLVTNAYSDADVVINAASCRSHPNIILSGAIKNMFGLVIGKRKALIHDLFWDNPSAFGRAIADIHRTIPADISFLDLTTVREGQGVPGVEPTIRPVGLLLGGPDAVAIDTVAANAVGYEQLRIWTTYHAGRMGLGEDDIRAIRISGLDWPSFDKHRLRFPLLTPPSKKSMYDRMSSFVNHTVLRSRPKLHQDSCTGCGDCARRCPVQCIEMTQQGMFNINLSRCADCGCCLKVCEQNAISLEPPDLAQSLRKVGSVVKLPFSNSTKATAQLKTQFRQGDQA